MSSAPCVAHARGFHLWEVGKPASVAVMLEDDRTPHVHYVRMSGEVLCIATPAIRAAVEQSRSLRRLLLRYVHIFVTQVAQTAYAQGALGLESQLARWLLMVHDRVDGDELALTHEFLSIMLGVQRAGVTLALQNLEGAAWGSKPLKRELPLSLCYC